MNTKSVSTITPVKPIRFNNKGIRYLVTSSTTVKVIPNIDKVNSCSLIIPSTVTHEGKNYIVNKIGTAAFAKNYDVCSISIPHTITTIEEEAFTNNHNLIQVISNATTPLIINENVFGTTLKNCKLIVPTKSLQAYKNSNTWKEFKFITDEMPFYVDDIAYEKTSETTVKVIKNVEKIYSGAITIPSSININKIKYNVTEISDIAFKNNESITKINIGNNITSIKAFTFSNCKNLTSITIPNTVTEIGKSAFSSSGIILFTFPNSITLIDTHLFIGCEQLTTITIPKGVTTIKEYSFGWCPKLTTLNCAIESPMAINSNMFFGTKISSCDLKVPIKNIESYQHTHIWKSFKSITEIKTEEPVTSITKKDNSVAPVLNENNVSIELEESSEATVEVFTENGQVLIHKTINKPQNNINTHHLSAGGYWLKITSNKGIFTKKFTKTL